MRTAWAAAALKLMLWGALAPADVDLPPPKYDHPYRGQIEFIYDFPVAFEGEHLWGYTVPSKRPGGKCIVHLSPIGSVVKQRGHERGHAAAPDQA